MTRRPIVRRSASARRRTATFTSTSTCTCTRTAPGMRAALATLAAGLGASLTTPALAGEPPIATPVVVEGDAIPELATAVTTIEDIAVADDGTWVVLADTLIADPSRDIVLLDANGLVEREGDPVPGLPGATVDFYLDLAILPGGRRLLVHAWVDAGSGTLVRVDDEILLKTGDPVLDARLALDGTVTSIDSVRAAGADQIVVRTTIDDGGSARDALLLVGTVAPATVEVAVIEGQDIPGVGTVGSLVTASTDYASDGTGGVVVGIDIAGEPAGSDGAILLRTAVGSFGVLAREGSPSPVPGRNWNSVFSRASDLRSGGAFWALQAQIAGPSATNQLLVRNNVVVIQEGDAIDTFNGSFPLQGFGTGPVQLTPDGAITWFADWDGLPDADRGLLRDLDLLVQTGVTAFDDVSIDGSPTDGVVLSDIDPGADGFIASDSGDAIIFTGAIDVPGTGTEREAAVIVTLAGPTCEGDINDDGAVDFLDLLLVLARWDTADAEADLNGNGLVEFQDLLLLLSAWGPC